MSACLPVPTFDFFLCPAGCNCSRGTNWGGSWQVYQEKREAAEEEIDRNRDRERKVETEVLVRKGAE